MNELPRFGFETWNRLQVAGIDLHCHVLLDHFHGKNESQLIVLPCQGAFNAAHGAIFDAYPLSHYQFPVGLRPAGT